MVAAHVLALSIGILVFFWVLGYSTLIAQAPFLQQPIGDFAAEQASYVLIANDSWRFPFLSLPNVNLPVGTNAAFFGGTPLLALVARVIGYATGSAPNLIGFWYFLCYALQGHSFFVLIRQITRERPLIAAGCALAGVLAFAFLTRFGHVSLEGHFLVIYAMAFGVQATRDDAQWRPILLWITLISVIALLIFAYLAVSTAAIFGAAVAILWWNGRLRFRDAVLATVGFVAVLAFTAWSAGVFWAASVSEPTDASSYSVLGFNLGGLFIPPESLIFPRQGLFRDWWGGHFYLGTGVMLLLAIAVAARPRQIVNTLWRLWPFVAVLLLLTVYSLSNRWYFGDTVIFEYSVPHWALPIIGLARAGGRLFWPVGYLLMAIGFALAIAYFRKWGPALVALALVLSIAESTAAIGYVSALAQKPQAFPLDYPGLQTVMDEHRFLRLYPSFWCDPGNDGSSKRVVHWQLQITSARARQDSNSAITVRKMKDCRLEAESMPAEILRPGDIDVFLAAPMLRAAFAGRPQSDIRAHCREFAMAPTAGFLCSGDWTAASRPPLRQLRSISDASLGLMSLNAPVKFGSYGDGGNFTGAGWWPMTEGEFIWTEGGATELQFSLPARGEAIRLDFTLYPFLGGSIASRTVRVEAEGQQLASWRFDEGGWTNRDLVIPAEMTGRALTLTFLQDDTRSPRDLGIGEDPRHVGFGLKQIDANVLTQ